MDKPQRIQRKRTKGWRMPENTVYVGRPTRWGNPFAEMDNPYESYRISTQLMRRPYSQLGYNSKQFVDGARKDLAGKNLACWCPLDQPCHADILIKIANGGFETPEPSLKKERK